MGTINYKTSDYITIGVRPYNDLELEKDLMEELQERATEYGSTIEQEVNDVIASYYECDLLDVEHELRRYSFYYFHVTLEPGYYEGFTIDIESNFSCAFDTWEDKREAQKEITQLKKLLTDCAGVGLVSCYPGWSTGYDDYETTLKAIRKAVKEMREEVKSTPTWRQYYRS